MTPAQVAHYPAKPRKVYYDTKKDEEILSVSQSIELPKKVSHCLRKPKKMVESVICDGTYVFGFKLMNRGSVSTILWSSNLIPLPQLVSPSCFDLLMALSRAVILDLGEMGGEEKAVVQVDSLSLPGSPF